jgi:coniferyl-aldehyde dehydrogenase
MTAHVLVKDDFVLSAILAKQRAAFLRDGPPSLARRKADLQKLKSALLARRQDFEKALDADFGGRSAYETRIMELISLIQGINYLRRNLKSWMRPETRHVAPHFLPGQAHVIYQPLGVVGIVSPWNYPMALALMPLATALAAGNRVMLKPSELTPETTALLTRMLAEIFPDEQVAVATGGAEVGAAFANLPFDHLVFTGSTAVGRSVMKAASENLVPVTLELGGKSPVIIDESASIERAAERVAYGKLANAGQTCIAPDYALVPEESVADFAAAYEAAVAQLYPDGIADDNYTSIVNSQHRGRLKALADDARRKGARVVEIGARGKGKVPRKMAPTVILDVTDDMAVMQDEIFGPVLPIVAYRDIDQAIAYVNRRPRPLALYYFGKRGENRNKVLARTTSGNVTINDTLLHYVQDALPFGGVGASGIGAYHGVEGFRSLSHAKGVFVQGRWNFTGMMRPPYSGRMTGLAIRYLLR